MTLCLTSALTRLRRIGREEESVFWTFIPVIPFRGARHVPSRCPQWALFLLLSLSGCWELLRLPVPTLPKGTALRPALGQHVWKQSHFQLSWILLIWTWQLWSWLLPRHDLIWSSLRLEKTETIIITLICKMRKLKHNMVQLFAQIHTLWGIETKFVAGCTYLLPPYYDTFIAFCPCKPKTQEKQKQKQKDKLVL